MVGVDLDYETISLGGGGGMLMVNCGKIVTMSHAMACASKRLTSKCLTNTPQ